MNQEFVKIIVGFILPTVKDMELIAQYGLLNWLVVFVVKMAGIILVLWLFLSTYEIRSPIITKKKTKG